MALNIYSPADVIIVLGGVVNISGYLDGTFLEMQKDIAPYRSRRTPDGTTARLYVNDKNYTVRFTLAHTSESNEILSKIQQIDEITQLGFFPLLIKDLRGSSLFFSPAAWIEGIPNQVFSTNVEGRTWEIKATGVLSTIGGNDSPDNLFDDLIKTVLAAAPQLGDIIGDFNVN